MRGLHVNRQVGDCVMSAGVVLAALCMIFTPAFAQEGNVSNRVIGGVEGELEKVHPLPPGGPAPRTADGHPDLSGVWFPNSAGVQLQGAPVDPAALVFKVTPDEMPPFQPEVAARFTASSAIDLEQGRLSSNGSGECAQGGVPANLLRNPTLYPIQLIQTPGLLAVLTEYTRDYRVIHTDGRPHPPYPDPTLNGDSVAHWEGDTLVVEVIALDVIRPSGDRDRFFAMHSDQKKVVERWSRPSVNYLLYQATIEDPATMTKPWTSGTRRWSLSANDEDLQEFWCTNNLQPEEYKNIGAYELKAKGQ